MSITISLPFCLFYWSRSVLCAYCRLPWPMISDFKSRCRKKWKNLRGKCPKLCVWCARSEIRMRLLFWPIFELTVRQARVQLAAQGGLVIFIYAWPGLTPSIVG